jgi:hypothetical protein
MYQRRAQEELAHAVQEFKQVEATYREYMRLKAPVEYWAAKGAEHEVSAKKIKKVLFWYTPVASVALLGGLALLLGLAISIANKETPLALFAIIGAMGLVWTTIFFWGGRLLVRFYLSQHHLALDARERATMVHTYLALSSEGKVEATERSLVLTAVFRPTTDGIVKEDGAPDLGLSNVASKLVSR